MDEANTSMYQLPSGSSDTVTSTSTGPSDTTLFFTDETGQTCLPEPLLSSDISDPLEDPPTPASSPAAPPTLQRSPSLMSIQTYVSRNTVLGDSSVWEALLSKLCEVIDEHRSLQQAKITSAEGYAEWTGVVVHRFLVLGLTRQNRKTIFLRIDRRRGLGGVMTFLAEGASTPANDVVMLADVKDTLVGMHQPESILQFERSPTLGELRSLFGVIIQALHRYQLWPANCWFFVSLLQEYLIEIGNGKFTRGCLPVPSLAPDIRQAIKHGVSSMNSPWIQLGPGNKQSSPPPRSRSFDTQRSHDERKTPTTDSARVSSLFPVFQIARAALKVWGARDKLKVGDKLGPLVETMEMCLKSADLVASLRNDSALYEQLVTPLLEQMVQCSNFVKEYTGSTARRRDTQADEYAANLMRLHEALVNRSTIECVLGVHHLLHDVDATRASILLGEMEYTPHARPDLTDTCLPDTRVEIIDSICRWAFGLCDATLQSGSASSSVLWLCGGDGSGKTAIINSLAARFSTLCSLGSIYAFNQGHPAETHPGNVFSTIARGIADYDPSYKDRLVAIIQEDTALRRTTDCKTQFNSFVTAFSTEGGDASGRCLIVIDEFDKSGDEATRGELLARLTEDADRIPPGVRIIVASRFESDIKDALHTNPPGVHVVMMEDIPLDTTLRDIRLYANHQLCGVPQFASDPVLFEQSVERIAQGAGRSFRRAASLCKAAVRSIDPIRALESALNRNERLEPLRAEVLRQQLDLAGSGYPAGEARLHAIFRIISSARDPLPLRVLLGLILEKADDELEEDIFLPRDTAMRLAAVLGKT